MLLSRNRDSEIIFVFPLHPLSLILSYYVFFVLFPSVPVISVVLSSTPKVPQPPQNKERSLHQRSFSSDQEDEGNEALDEPLRPKKQTEAGKRNRNLNQL